MSDTSKRASQGGAGVPALGATSSVMLPLSFILVGLVAFLTGIGWLLLQPSLLATYHYNQTIIAVTHLFVLGWICSVIMGAMYQLVPVALETSLYSLRLARWHLILHVIGFSGMVWMFQEWNLKQVGHFGSVLAVGVGLFVYNLARTLWRVPRWTLPATAITTVLAWLSFTVVVGLTVAAGKCTYDATPTATWTGGLLAGLRTATGLVSRFDPVSAMHAHAHLGGIGCFTVLIVGVSYKLVPMFTLSEVQSLKRAGFSVLLLNFGLAGAFATILLRSPWKFFFALMLLAALVLYGVEMRAILRARKRRTLDWGLRYFLTAIALLGPTGLMAAVLSWPDLPLTEWTGQLETAYAFTALLGVVTFAIMGMLYKIIPFLVWYRRYSKQIGRTQVPSLSQLYSARLQSVGYWCFLAGLILVSLGIIAGHASCIRLGCIGMAISATTLVCNVGLMLSHFLRPTVPERVVPRLTVSASI